MTLAVGSFSSQSMKRREDGWNSRFHIGSGERPQYNALHDPNMRHYFENAAIQKHLIRTGQIDAHGRVINLERARGKLHIIEEEFKEAERAEFWRMKEEEDIKDRVQKKRHMALELARSRELVMHLKQDHHIRRAIVGAMFEAQGATQDYSQRVSRGTTRRGSTRGSTRTTTGATTSSMTGSTTESMRATNPRLSSGSIADSGSNSNN